MDDSAKKAKPNKLRSKEHRQRKKKFIDTLQTKVKSLETQILNLKIENKRLNDMLKTEASLKSACIDEKKPGTIQQLEDYVYVTLPKMMRETPEKVRFTMLDQEFNEAADYGDERISCIKSAFRTIIDGIVCAEAKSFYS